MAAPSRPTERVLRRALLSSVYPVAGGSGSCCCRCPFGAKRYLLTDNVVKLKEFQQMKVIAAYNLPGTKETYFQNLEEKLSQNKLILKAELKTLLHLCETQNDLELAKNVIYSRLHIKDFSCHLDTNFQMSCPDSGLSSSNFHPANTSWIPTVCQVLRLENRYHAENRNVTWGEYKFGPLFMRLCYELDLEESALELITNQHLRGFFSDSTSFNILMDMLFIKGKYKSALDVLIEMKKQDVKFSKDTYILAFAICYKLNSPESFKICTTLREEALIKGDVLSRRASCFAVALALNQNQVAKAISIFSQIMKTQNITCVNLNIIIHIHSNMLETVVNILKDAAERNVSNFVKRHEFSEEVLATVREKVKDFPALLTKFDEIYGKLHLSGQVTTHTLDTLLCHTPRDRKYPVALFNKKTISHRTFQPLNQSLLAE